MNKGVCLLCLAIDRKIFNIANTHLKHIYEKITDFEIQSDSYNLCFICRKRLQQCYELRQLAKQTQRLLKNYQDNKIDSNYESHKSLTELSASKLNIVSIPNINIPIKEEPDVDEFFLKHFIETTDDELDLSLNTGIEQSISKKQDISEDNNRKQQILQSPVEEVASRKDLPIEKRIHGQLKDLANTSKNIGTFKCGPSLSKRKGRTLIRKNSNSGRNRVVPKRMAKNIKTTASPVKATVTVNTDIHKPNVLKTEKSKHILTTDLVKANKQGEIVITVGPNVNTNKCTEEEKIKYSCDICSYETKKKYILEYHVLVAHGDSSDILYACKYCPYVSKWKKNTETHERWHTGEKVYSCDLCEWKFTEKGSLKKHKRTHTGEKPYSCDMCERKFTVISSLKTHRRTHTGEKPYSCDICHRQFAQSSALKIHKRTHTGVKPYSCDICQKQFSVNDALQRHIRIHTGERPYSCEICQRKFTVRSALKEHKRIHTGEKPYSCDVCQRKFSVRCSLQTHKRTHTGEKPYSCDICKKRFEWRGKLNAHKKKCK